MRIVTFREFDFAQHVSVAPVQTLKDDIWIEGATFARGSHYRAFAAKECDWVVFDPKATDPEGKMPVKRFFKH